jgi:excisionase family DNA binding protein
MRANCGSLEVEASNQTPARLADCPDVLRVEQAAKILGIGRNTAYTAVRNGQIPAVKIGGRLLVPKMALERLLGATGAGG